MNAPENSFPKGGGALRGIGEARNLRAIFANRAMIVTTPARRVVESRFFVCSRRYPSLG